MAKIYFSSDLETGENGVTYIISEDDKNYSLILIGFDEPINVDMKTPIVNASIEIFENDSWTILVCRKKDSSYKGKKNKVYGIFYSDMFKFRLIFGDTIFETDDTKDGKFGIYKPGAIIELQKRNKVIYYLLTKDGWIELGDISDELIFELFEGNKLLNEFLEIIHPKIKKLA